MGPLPALQTGWTYWTHFLTSKTGCETQHWHIVPAGATACWALLSLRWTSAHWTGKKTEVYWLLKTDSPQKYYGSRQLFNWCCSNSNTCAMLLVPTPYVYPNNMNKFCIKMSEHIKTLLCIFLRCVITLSQMFKPRESHKSTQGNGAFQCTHTAHACSVFSCHSMYTPENVQVHFHILSW